MTDRVGLQPWFELQHLRREDPENPEDRFKSYLLLVLRDRPSHYYCFTCRQLHDVNHTGPPPSKHQALDSGKVHHRDNRRNSSFHYIEIGGQYRKSILPFHNAQKVMAHNRLHGSSSECVDFLYRRLQFPNSPTYADVLFEVEARCTTAHVLLRTQLLLEVRARNRRETHTVHDHGQQGLTETDRGREDFDLHSNLCHHREPKQVWSLLLQSKLADRAYWRCEWCPTEVKLRKYRLHTGAEVLCITQWMNLGQMLSPEDRAWRAHVGKFFRCHEAFHEFQENEWFGMYGSPMKAFESQPGVTAQQITDANLKTMFSWFPPLSRDGLARPMSFKEEYHRWRYIIRWHGYPQVD